MKKCVILTMTVFLTILANGQNLKSVDYFTELGKSDLSKLWCADSIRVDENGEKTAFPEPLGYIGDNFQRFYIHFTSIEKSKEDPYIYKVIGKTKVKNNICCFTGTILLLQKRLYKKSESPNFKQGYVVCKVSLYEDSTQNSSGFINGLLTSNFCIDRKGELSYDALTISADSYSNNQCKATWTSYKTRKSKKCNWGDFRMPDSEELDGGSGIVVIYEKYKEFGWKTFIDADSSDENIAKKASEIEERKWWNE